MAGIWFPDIPLAKESDIAKPSVRGGGNTKLQDIGKLLTEDTKAIGLLVRAL